MSTYMYLECQDHTPPLTSDGEVGQHHYDLPRICDEISKRDLFAANAKADLGIDYGGYFTNNAARFLAQHPNCRIGIRDEYGIEYPTTETEVSK